MKQTPFNAPHQARRERNAKWMIWLWRQLAKLSLKSQHRLGAGIGWMAWLIPNQAKRAAQLNLDWCYPDLTPKQRHQLLRQTMIEFGRSITEMGGAFFWRKDQLNPLVLDVKGGEYLQAAKRNEQGLMILVPHFGSWEMVGHWLTFNDTPYHALYKRPLSQTAQDFIVQRRSRFGVHLSPANQRGLAIQLKALKQGKTIALLPDQNPKRDSGQFADFYGHPALTMTLASSIAQKQPLQVLFIVAERMPNQGFRIHVRPASDGFFDADMATSLSHLNQDIEQLIAINPAQYQWVYQRFRNQPNGLDPYKTGHL